jgi:hypothetical protein
MRHRHPILRQSIDTNPSSCLAPYLLEAAGILAAPCTIRTDPSWRSDLTPTAALVERLRFHKPCRAHKRSPCQSEKIHM